jgi:hypothetical protein
VFVARQRHSKPRADRQARETTRFAHAIHRTLMWVAAASLMATAITVNLSSQDRNSHDPRTEELHPLAARRACPAVRD